MVRKHLSSRRELLEGRDEVRNGSTEWFALRPCDYVTIFSQPLLAWPDTAKESRFCLLPAGSVIGNTAFCVLGDHAWLLPLLNSTTGWRVITMICQSRDERGGQLRYRLLPQSIARFPIPCVTDDLRRRMSLVASGQHVHDEGVERAMAELFWPLGLT